MHSEPTPPTITPQEIARAQWAFAQTFVLITAVELDVFSALQEGACGAAELAERIGASRRGLVFLLDALVGMGLLVRRGERYENAPGAGPLLAAGGAESRRGGVLRFRRLIGDWLGLTEAVRSGRPVVDVGAEEGPGYFKDLVPHLFVSNLGAARAAAAELKRTLPRFDVAALDVAAGSGVFGIALAQAHDGVVVTALDHGEVLEVTRSFVEKHGLVARFHYLPGNLRTVELAEGLFDAAFLGHILHSEGEAESRRLLARIARTLRPGGTVVIAEFLVEEDRSGPLQSLLFALNMLVHAEEGNVFSFRQIAAWLDEAGFEQVRPLAVEGASPLILASRRP